jgi:hypothetical protein
MVAFAIHDLRRKWLDKQAKDAKAACEKCVALGVAHVEKTGEKSMKVDIWTVEGTFLGLVDVFEVYTTEEDARDRLAHYRDMAGHVEEEILGLSVKHQGKPQTVYTKRELRVGPANKDKDAMLTALKSDDSTAALVSETYHWKQLCAWVGELPTDDDGEPVFPEHVQGKISYEETYTIQSRKG